MVDIDTFIFDVDGTLLDSLKDFSLVTNRVLADCGLETLSDRDVESFMHGYNVLEGRFLKAGLDASFSSIFQAKWRAEYLRDGLANTQPFPAVEETLETLLERGAKLAALSNKFDEGTQYALKSFLPQYFELAYGAKDDIPNKPDPTGLLRLIEELDSFPSATAYIGDTPRDIQAAHNAGCFAVGVTWGFFGEEAMRATDADLIIDTFDQLLELYTIPYFEDEEEDILS